MDLHNEPVRIISKQLPSQNHVVLTKKRGRPSLTPEQRQARARGRFMMKEYCKKTQSLIQPAGLALANGYLLQGLKQLSPTHQAMVAGFAQGLLKIPDTPDGTKRWFSMYISYLDCVYPGVMKKESGRLVRLLSVNPQGLTRLQLLHGMYERYAGASAGWQNSMRQCLEKVIQRGRKSFAPHLLGIHFDRERQLYLLKVL